MKNFTIINYGVANYNSITGIRSLGIIIITSNKSEIKKSDFIILPGVEHFLQKKFDQI